MPEAMFVNSGKSALLFVAVSASRQPRIRQPTVGDDSRASVHLALEVDATVINADTPGPLTHPAHELTNAGLIGNTCC